MEEKIEEFRKFLEIKEGKLDDIRNLNCEIKYIDHKREKLRSEYYDLAENGEKMFISFQIYPSGRIFSILNYEENVKMIKNILKEKSIKYSWTYGPSYSFRDVNLSQCEDYISRHDVNLLLKFIEKL